jgi:hypothetical protein
MKNMNRQMVASYVRCRACGTILQSIHTHDYKTCSCDNETMVDGGLDYQRYGGMDLSLVEPFAVYDDESFLKVREHMYRGGHGKDMKGPFRLTRLFEMTDEHLNAMLTYPCPPWQLKLIKKEVQYRKKRNISIAD